ncbi:unnamed protein product [Blepharisma stoltei]|uniref:Uncharacterized protein n=1 Tax=Blepharisma stoltei TaxID=1481888 RepID=A0AAU9K4V4_9CILI|nr:unnamed protein product [Blepharisma stoltei]
MYSDIESGGAVTSSSRKLIGKLYISEDLLDSESRSFPEDKLELEELIEGHLLLGLFLQKSEISRLSRLFTLITILFFELGLQGLLFFSYEKFDPEAYTEAIFSEFSSKFFGYAILAATIAMPIEAFMLILLSINKKEKSGKFLVFTGLGVLILIGSITGIYMIDYGYMYWAICLAIEVILEICVVESFLMFVRYFMIQGFGSMK